MLARLRAGQPVARTALARSGVLALPGMAVARRLATGDALAPATPGADKSVSTEKAPQVDKASLSAFTGAPSSQLEKRVVKIYQQAQTVQNATQNTIPWRVQWEDQQTRRWSNPLMGWTSTNDPLSNTHMTLEFLTAEDAARFCEQNGAPDSRLPPATPLTTLPPQAPTLCDAQ